MITKPKYLNLKLKEVLANLLKSNDKITVSYILKELNLAPSLSIRRTFSQDAMLKAHIFGILKGLKSQRALIKELTKNPGDALNLGFDRGETASILPTQQALSHFIKTLTIDQKRLVDFVVKTINELADKYNIVLDRTVFKKRESLSPLTDIKERTNKEKELIHFVKGELSKRIKFDINYNSIFEKEDYLNLLIHIALSQDFAENGAKVLSTIIEKRTPLADSLFYHLKKNSFRDLQKMFEDTFDILVKIAKRSKLISDRPFDVAIDATSWFFYGDTNHPMIVGTKPERGTSWCFKFITIDVVNHGQRFTLFALPVLPQDDQTDLVEKLLLFAKERVHIGTAYLDRGFYGTPVINLLNKMDIKYIMPTKENSKAITSTNTLKAPFIRRNMPLGTCRFNLIVIERETKRDEARKRHGFATNMDVTQNDTLMMKRVGEMYRRRWQIETGYRSKKYVFRGKTTSLNYTIRYFYFMLSVILYNYWILIDLLLLAYFDLNTTKTQITAKMFSIKLITLANPGG